MRAPAPRFQSCVDLHDPTAYANSARHRSRRRVSSELCVLPTRLSRHRVFSPASAWQLFHWPWPLACVACLPSLFFWVLPMAWEALKQPVLQAQPDLPVPRFPWLACVCVVASEPPLRFDERSTPPV